MKTIGLLGGMSWKSTARYYEEINKLINMHLGNDHSAKLVLLSVDFQKVLNHQERTNWPGVIDVLIPQIKQLIKAGPDFIAITSNTIHQIANELEAKIHLPLIGIGDAVASELKKMKIKKVGILGTALTVNGDYYPDRLKKHSLELILPSQKRIQQVDQLIFSQLIKGKAGNDSRNLIVEISREMKKKGAEAVILGCTELEMIDISPLHGELLIIDSLHAHCRSIVQAALSK